MSQETKTEEAMPEVNAQLSYRDWLASTRMKAQLRPLTEQELARPYAKFYREPATPDPAAMAMMDKPCDSEKALYPDQINDLLDPGYLNVETGWCVLPNGAGFVAYCEHYDDITPAMIDWWFAWHCLEDLRYRIWYPTHHAGILVSPDTRRRILDPYIPVREKNWGATHHVTENVGGVMENIDITFLSPQDFGFDMKRWKEPGVATFAGGYGWRSPVERSEQSITSAALMCHFFRIVPGGLEHRARFWMGYRISNGEPELTLPQGVAIPASSVQGLAYHTVSEFKNLSVLLPELYREFGGRMTA